MPDMLSVERFDTRLTMSTVARPEDVEALREFNRFFTARMGLTRGRYLGTSHPLAEARVLYELGAGTTETAQLRTALDIDAGQLSHLLARLDSEGLVQRERAGRTQRVRLTRTGRESFETLNERSAQEIGQILDALRGARPAIEAMHALRRAIDP